MNAFSSSMAASPWTMLDVANHLWQSTAVALAIGALLLLFGRNLPARTRRALGWMALAKFAVPVAALSHFLTTVNGTPERWLESGRLTLPVALAPAMLLSAPGSDSGRDLFGPAVIGIWCVGFIALFGSWLLRGAVLRRRTLALASPLSPALTGPIESAARALGLAKAPPCVAVPADHSPGALGIFRPVVLLPRGLEETMTPAELHSVLLHEFIHVQRHDNFWSAGQTFFLSFLWFHPLVWLLHRQLSLETEKSCDERVLAVTADPASYANGIVKCVRHCLGLAQPAFMGVSTPPVRARIENILGHNPKKQYRAARTFAVAAGVLAVTLSGHAGSFDKGTPAAVPTPSETPEKNVPSAEAPRADLVPVSVTISIEVDGNYRLNGKPVALSTLQNELRSFAQQQPQPSMIIHANPRTRFEQVVALFDEFKGAGLSKFSVQTSSENEPGPTQPSHPLSNWYLGPEIPAPVSVPTEPVVSPVTPTALPAPTAVESIASDVVPAAPLAPAPAARVDSDVAPAPEKTAAPKTSSAITPVPSTALPPTSSPASPPALIVYDVSKLDQRPEPRFQAKPIYPAAQRRRATAGDVVVDFIVDVKGNVINAFAIRSSQVEFEEPALTAVKQWKFRPGMKNKQPVNTHMQVPIVFTTRDMN